VSSHEQKITLGIDVSKDKLDIFEWDSGRSWQIANDVPAIQEFLVSLDGATQIAIEPTSTYHLELTNQAYAAGHEVFLINPRQLVHYRESVGERNKSDKADAWLLARYLNRERSELRAYTPLSGDAQLVWTLIKRRALVVATIKQLRQSLAEPKIPAKSAIREMTRLVERIELRILKLIDRIGWTDDYRRCLTIPGIGPLNAAALVAAFHRGAFSSANAFIAYLGLDVRIRESGKFKGKRKLTKHGESELRRLLYCAANPARCYEPFDQYRSKQLDKGLSKIAANVIVARKLARIAFALLRDRQTFRTKPSQARDAA